MYYPLASGLSIHSAMSEVPWYCTNEPRVLLGEYGLPPPGVGGIIIGGGVDGKEGKRKDKGEHTPRSGANSTFSTEASAGIEAFTASTSTSDGTVTPVTLSRAPSRTHSRSPSFASHSRGASRAGGFLSVNGSVSPLSERRATAPPTSPASVRLPHPILRLDGASEEEVAARLVALSELASGQSINVQVKVPECKDAGPDDDVKIPTPPPMAKDGIHKAMVRKVRMLAGMGNKAKFNLPHAASNNDDNKEYTMVRSIAGLESVFDAHTMMNDQDESMRTPFTGGEPPQTKGASTSSSSSQRSQESTESEQQRQYRLRVREMFDSIPSLAASGGSAANSVVWISNLKVDAKSRRQRCMRLFTRSILIHARNDKEFMNQIQLVSQSLGLLTPADVDPYMRCWVNDALRRKTVHKNTLKRQLDNLSKQKYYNANCFGDPTKNPTCKRLYNAWLKSSALGLHGRLIDVTEEVQKLSEQRIVALQVKGFIRCCRRGIKSKINKQHLVAVDEEVEEIDAMDELAATLESSNREWEPLALPSVEHRRSSAGSPLLAEDIPQQPDKKLRKFGRRPAASLARKARRNEEAARRKAMGSTATTEEAESSDDEDWERTPAEEEQRRVYLQSQQDLRAKWAAYVDKLNRQRSATHILSDMGLGAGAVRGAHAAVAVQGPANKQVEVPNVHEAYAVLLCSLIRMQPDLAHTPLASDVDVSTLNDDSAPAAKLTQNVPSSPSPTPSSQKQPVSTDAPRVSPLFNPSMDSASRKILDDFAQLHGISSVFRELILLQLLTSNLNRTWSYFERCMDCLDRLDRLRTAAADPSSAMVDGTVYWTNNERLVLVQCVERLAQWSARCVAQSTRVFSLPLKLFDKPVVANGGEGEESGRRQTMVGVNPFDPRSPALHNTHLEAFRACISVLQRCWRILADMHVNDFLGVRPSTSALRPGTSHKQQQETETTLDSILAIYPLEDWLEPHLSKLSDGLYEGLVYAAGKMAELKSTVPSSTSSASSFHSDLHLTLVLHALIGECHFHHTLIDRFFLPLLGPALGRPDATTLKVTGMGMDDGLLLLPAHPLVRAGVIGMLSKFGRESERYITKQRIPALLASQRNAASNQGQLTASFNEVFAIYDELAWLSYATQPRALDLNTGAPSMRVQSATRQTWRYLKQTFSVAVEGYLDAILHAIFDVLQEMEKESRSKGSATPSSNHFITLCSQIDKFVSMVSSKPCSDTHRRRVLDAMASLLLHHAETRLLAPFTSQGLVEELQARHYLTARFIVERDESNDKHSKGKPEHKHGYDSILPPLTNNAVQKLNELRAVNTKLECLHQKLMPPSDGSSSVDSTERGPHALQLRNLLLQCLATIAADITAIHAAPTIHALLYTKVSSNGAAERWSSQRVEQCLSPLLGFWYQQLDRLKQSRLHADLIRELGLLLLLEVMDLLSPEIRNIQRTIIDQTVYWQRRDKEKMFGREQFNRISEAIKLFKAFVSDVCGVPAYYFTSTMPQRPGCMTPPIAQQLLLGPYAGRSLANEPVLTRPNHSPSGSPPNGNGRASPVPAPDPTSAAHHRTTSSMGGGMNVPPPQNGYKLPPTWSAIPVMLCEIWKFDKLLAVYQAPSSVLIPLYLCHHDPLTPLSSSERKAEERQMAATRAAMELSMKHAPSSRSLAGNQTPTQMGGLLAPIGSSGTATPTGSAPSPFSPTASSSSSPWPHPFVVLGLSRYDIWRLLSHREKTQDDSAAKEFLAKSSKPEKNKEQEPPTSGFKLGKIFGK